MIAGMRPHPDHLGGTWCLQAASAQDALLAQPSTIVHDGVAPVVEVRPLAVGGFGRCAHGCAPTAPGVAQPAVQQQALYSS